MIAYKICVQRFSKNNFYVNILLVTFNQETTFRNKLHDMPKLLCSAKGKLA